MFRRPLILCSVMLTLFCIVVLTPRVSYAQAHIPTSNCASNTHWKTVGTGDSSSGSAHMHAQLQALYDANGNFCYRIIGNAYFDEPFSWPDQELDAGLYDRTANGSDNIHTAYCTTRESCIYLSSTNSTDKYEAGGPGNSVGIAQGYGECYYSVDAYAWTSDFDAQTDAIEIPGCH